MKNTLKILVERQKKENRTEHKRQRIIDGLDAFFGDEGRVENKEGVRQYKYNDFNTPGAPIKILVKVKTHIVKLYLKSLDGEGCFDEWTGAYYYNIIDHDEKWILDEIVENVAYSLKITKYL